MVAVKLEGRLGNQLFQYAFIYAVAKRLNTKFYLDKSVDYFLLDKYFMVERDFCWFFDNYIFSIEGFKNIFSHHLRYKFYRLLKWYFNLKKITFSNAAHPSIQLNELKNNSVYLGFFQSEEYFNTDRDEILKLFHIKEVFRAHFKKVFDQIPKAKKHVVVHIRRGDYLNENLTLDIGYYRAAIEHIHDQHNYYIFISDDVEFVEDAFSYLTNSYISKNNEIIDLQFLINADICILSNSSFSWWGAYLNNKNAKVIAPKFWFGNKFNGELPVDIIHDSWVSFMV
jgi:hypothetical protein